MKKLRKRWKRTWKNRENDGNIKGAKKLKEGRKRKRGKTESVKFSSKEISSSRMSNSVILASSSHRTCEHSYVFVESLKRRTISYIRNIHKNGIPGI